MPARLNTGSDVQYAALDGSTIATVGNAFIVTVLVAVLVQVLPLVKLYAIVYVPAANSAGLSSVALAFTTVVPLKIRNLPLAGEPVSVTASADLQ